MNEEFGPLEAELRQALRPCGLSSESRAALVRTLQASGLDDEAASAALAAGLRELRPSGLSERRRRQLLFQLALASRPRWVPMLKWAAALLVVSAGTIAYVHFNADDTAARPEISEARISPALQDGDAPLQVSLAGVQREYSHPERINSYLVSKKHGDCLRLPDGRHVQQVTCDFVDEIQWRSQQAENRCYIEQRPRREVMYVSVPLQ